jgi:hypothetical protein
MFNWLGNKHECNSVIPDDTLDKELELQMELDNLHRLMESEDHLRKTEEYNLMEASYVMYVHFVDGSSGLRIERKFNGYYLYGLFNFHSLNNQDYHYIKPSVTAADQRQKIKDNLPTHGITDGDTVYLAHTISKVEFSEITTKGED